MARFMIEANDAVDSGHVEVTQGTERVHIEFTRKDDFKCGFALTRAEVRSLIIVLLGGNPHG